MFESKSWVPKVAAREFVSFVASRLATGVIEWFGPLLLFKIGLDQDLFGVKGFVAKIVCSVLVVILNYVFSKLLGIHQKEKECGRTGKSKRKIGNAYKKRVLRRSFFVGFRIARRSRLW